MAAVPAHPIASGWTGKVDESHIPACCRKNGKHHCTMPDGATDGTTSADAPPVNSVSATGCCTGFPSDLASATAPVAAIPSTGAATLTLSAQRRITQRRIETARSSDRRIQPQRGPPSEEL